MNTIEKIRAEIERNRQAIRVLNEHTAPEQMSKTCAIFQYSDSILSELLSFLDTLEESEKPMNQDELKKEIENQLAIFPYTKVSPELPESRWIVIRKELYMFARHFAQWGAEHAKIDVTDFCKPIDPGIAQCIADHSWEMLGEDEKPVPNDLEAAAKAYALDTAEDSEQYSARYLGYKDGAKWQKEQDDKELSDKIAAAYQLGVKDKEQKFVEGLDEAAEDFARQYDNGTCDGIAQDCFKAGAEWMAGQFESVGTFPVEDAKGGYWPTEYFIRKK